jgi:MFS family permease
VPRFVVDISPLRKYRHFRRLWAGQVVSGLGSQLTLVAVSFQAYALTRSTLVVGLIGLTQLVPLLAGALWGGALADAMDRRKVLILTQVAMATGVGGLVVNGSFSHPACGPYSSARPPTLVSRGLTGLRAGRRCPCSLTVRT